MEAAGMDARRAGLPRRTTLRCSVSLALALWAASGAASPKRSNAEGAASVEANATASQTFADARLADRYPTLRALVVARGNCIVFEYYRNGLDAGTRSPVYSVTKSVLSILVGIAIDKGYLRLDEKLSELLPETFEAAVDPRTRDIAVRDLLTMTGGFDQAGAAVRFSNAGVPVHESWRWMIYRPMKYPPGTHFVYSDAEADLLSVVLSKTVRQSAESFAREMLFDPLGIDRYDWVDDADGHLAGGSGLSLTARDMAKVGLLYLHRGRWGDRQIVSEDFVRDSTVKHNDGGPPVNAAYGYLWWVTTKANRSAFVAAGHNSQLIYVAPSLDLVVAVAAESIPGGSQAFVNDVVLPAAATMPQPVPCFVRLAPDGSD
jgi:CubicO group peptidase (beta-lactamase class C family)